MRRIPLVLRRMLPTSLAVSSDTRKVRRSVLALVYMAWATKKGVEKCIVQGERMACEL